MYVALLAVRCRLSLVYLNNMVVVLWSAAEHIDHVKEILALLRNKKFTLKFKSCNFLPK